MSLELMEGIPLGKIEPASRVDLIGQELEIKRHLGVQWCWAAVTELLYKWYQKSGADQCSIAKGYLQKDEADPVEVCDKSGEVLDGWDKYTVLDRVLRTLGLLPEAGGVVKVSKPGSHLGLVRDRLLDGNAVCLRMDFGGDGHFVAITRLEAASEPNELIEVQNPTGPHIAWVPKAKIFGPTIRYLGWVKLDRIYNVREEG